MNEIDYKRARSANLQQRAAEVHELAKRVTDPKIKQTLTRMAATYERAANARQQEARRLGMAGTSETMPSTTTDR